MELSKCTWPQVEEYLKKSKTILIPIGSTEQHGPTGIIGTDFETANHIALEAGKKSELMVAPPICFGMALHHMGFPGTISLKPQTLIQVIKEVVDCLKQHGFQKFLFVNGHGGNIPTIQTAFCAIKDGDDRSVLKLVNWWQMAEVQKYEEGPFGEENGFHATCGEVSVTQYLFPKAFEIIPNTQFDINRHEYSMPMTGTEFREAFPDGRMFSNPGLATSEHGEKLFEISTDAIAKIAASL